MALPVPRVVQTQGHKLQNGICQPLVMTVSGGSHGERVLEDSGGLEEHIGDTTT